MLHVLLFLAGVRSRFEYFMIQNISQYFHPKIYVCSFYNQLLPRPSVVFHHPIGRSENEMKDGPFPAELGRPPLRLLMALDRHKC